jgi:hypothetical protein
MAGHRPAATEEYIEFINEPGSPAPSWVHPLPPHALFSAGEGHGVWGIVSTPSPGSCVRPLIRVAGLRPASPGHTPVRGGGIGGIASPRPGTGRATVDGM